MMYWIFVGRMRKNDTELQGLTKGKGKLYGKRRSDLNENIAVMY